MSLPLPNLDDRTYADLVEEARGLLVALAPDLTHHNPSDPLITLTELFAYFTEILLFRLNVVTDANRKAFLKLLNGPQWQPPETRAGLDAEVRRTVLALRQTDRAVTPADFEFLARLADDQQRVARTRCIPDVDLTRDADARFADAPGHVSVVIVPVPQPANAPPILDTLIGIVADYLDPRRLIATRVHVVGPRTVPIHVQVTVHLMPTSRLDAVQMRVRDALTAWFDPFVGRDGSGWPFGRSVHVSDIYRLLDGLEGVDFVERTLPPGSATPLDEVRTSAAFAGRLLRNADGTLIRITLEPDELVDATIDTDNDILFVIPNS